jgi:hypothetical protein
MANRRGIGSPRPLDLGSTTEIRSNRGSTRARVPDTWTRSSDSGGQGVSEWDARALAPNRWGHGKARPAGQQRGAGTDADTH